MNLKIKATGKYMNANLFSSFKKGKYFKGNVGHLLIVAESFHAFHSFLIMRNFPLFPNQLIMRNLVFIFSTFHHVTLILKLSIFA